MLMLLREVPFLFVTFAVVFGDVAQQWQKLSLSHFKTGKSKNLIYSWLSPTEAFDRRVQTTKRFLKTII